jgi:hypothetical protein
VKKRLIAVVSEPARPVEVPGGRRVAADWPRRPAVVIAASAVLALALRLFQLSRPGYLSGYTQYDDGIYFGNALRLVHGAIAYRDLAMVQPPGSMLLMAPVARHPLLPKLRYARWHVTRFASESSCCDVPPCGMHVPPLQAGEYEDLKVRDDRDP